MRATSARAHKLNRRALTFITNATKNSTWSYLPGEPRGATPDASRRERRRGGGGGDQREKHVLTLVSAYARCGSLAKAQELFDKLPVRNTGSWNALIGGYAQQGHCKGALDCLKMMQLEGVFPDAVTFSCILKACGSTGAIDKGQEIHFEIAKGGLLEKNVFVGTALLDMYARCGFLVEAQEVFDDLPVRDVVSWSALIAGYARHGCGEEALKCYRGMQDEGVFPNNVTFICILKACGSIRAGDRGKEIHVEIVRDGLLENDVVVGNALLDMYAKCGMLTKAQEVFDHLPTQNVASWNALIAGYSQHGHGEEALNCYKCMQSKHVSRNVVTFLCILKACGSIGAADKCQEIHAEIVRDGLLKDILVGNALVDTYARCGLLAKAHDVFDELPVHDVVSWSTLIGGYSQQGLFQEALNCFEEMRREGISPDAVTIVSILKACVSIGTKDKCEEIYSLAVREGLLEKDIFVGASLIDLYAKCGLLDKAQEVFNQLPVQDVVSWSVLIAGYAQKGDYEEALTLFERMQCENVSPDAGVFVCIFKACASIGAIDKGQKVHAEIVKMGLLEKDVVVGNALVDMYAKCGMLTKAQEALDNLPVRNVVSWNALIAGYAQHGHGEAALNCFERMQLEGISPNAVTFVCILKACGGISASGKGQDIHAQIMREGLLEKDIALGNVLVDMYTKCGLIAKAEEVFSNLPVRDVVSWNSVLAGYAQHGHVEKAVSFFGQMQLEGVLPDGGTFVCILKACGSAGAVNKGQEFHDEIIRKGLFEKDIVLANALVDMYAKCGFLSKAQEVFENLPARTIASWNALIAGYANHKHGKEALDCFGRMQFEGISPDIVTYICVLKACGSIGASDKGQEIHAEIIEAGLLEKHIIVGTALVDMYAKCVLLAKAHEVLENLPIRNVVTWNALIAGYSQHGDGEKALDCFEKMKQEGVAPDAVTFVCSLKACGSIGAADKGEEVHAEIVKEGLLEDYVVVGTALVDMYAKCGMLGKAQGVFKSLPVRNLVSWNALIAGLALLGKAEDLFCVVDKMIGEGLEPDLVTFTSMLNACSHMGLLDMGQRCFETMTTSYCIVPTLEHHACMVDLFGRAGQLDKALAAANEMPFSANLAVWHTLLGACRKWGNMDVGRVAFEHAIQLDEKNAGAHVSMSNIYLDAGRLEGWG